MYKNSLKTFLLLLLISGCARNITPIPKVELKKSKIYQQSSKELEEAKAFGKRLEEIDVNPIYLYIGAKDMVNTINSPLLPIDFRTVTMYAGSIFGKKVIIISDEVTAREYFLNPKLKNRLFELEGVISEFNEKKESKESGVDFGFNIGKGKGETDTDNDFNDGDNISSLTISILLKQNGKVIDGQKSTIDIYSSTRGYYIGLSINGNGFGLKAYHNKKEGVGEALDRVLYYSLHQLLKRLFADELNNRSIILKNKKENLKVISKNSNSSKPDKSERLIILQFQPTPHNYRY